MIESANREILQAAGEAELRRRDAARLPALIAALDDLLNELEELNLHGTPEAPRACRLRAAELVGEAMRLGAVPALPETVAGLMECVYAAQDSALLRRRRTGWGLDE